MVLGVLASIAAPYLIKELVGGRKLGGKIHKTGPHLMHKNEFVLPAGVKPTAAQRKAVKQGKKAAAKRKAASKRKAAPKRKSAPKRKKMTFE